MAIEQIGGPTVARSAKRVGSRAKATRRRRLLFLTLLLIAISPLIAWCAARALIVKADLPQADAIVVLSGSATYVERSMWVAQLYREGRAPIVVLTNDGLISGWDGQRNPHFYELTSRRLQEQGVPADCIQVASGQALGTYAESLLLREHATNQKFRSLLVVTSAYHSRRALWSMRRAFDGTGILVGIDGLPPGWQTPSPWLWWTRRFGWKVVAGEYVKMIYYWTQY